MTNPTTGDNPLIEIARAIGRLEALVGAALSQQTNHETRIAALEEFKTKAMVYVTILSAGVGLVGWAIQTWLK